MPIQIRNLLPSDREPLSCLLSRIPQFDRDDINLALELIDIAIGNTDQKDYSFLIAEDNTGDVIGYACFGPTPLTDRTFSLYWIAVDPTMAGHGVGTLLLRTVEEQLAARGARLIFLETSSDPSYELTRRFYQKNDYQPAEIFHDFFRDGEDRVIFVKRFQRINLETGTGIP